MQPKIEEEAEQSSSSDSASNHSHEGDLPFSTVSPSVVSGASLPKRGTIAVQKPIFAK